LIGTCLLVQCKRCTALNGSHKAVMAHQAAPACIQNVEAEGCRLITSCLKSPTSFEVMVG